MGRQSSAAKPRTDVYNERSNGGIGWRMKREALPES